MSKKLTPLEALVVIYNSQDIMGGYDDFWKAFRVIEKAIKALEIIKEKRVDISALFICFKEYDLETFNAYATATKGELPLTEEEYDFLNEVLINTHEVKAKIQKLLKKELL